MMCWRSSSSRHGLELLGCLLHPVSMSCRACEVERSIEIGSDSLFGSHVSGFIGSLEASQLSSKLLANGLSCSFLICCSHARTCFSRAFLTGVPLPTNASSTSQPNNNFYTHLRPTPPPTQALPSACTGALSVAAPHRPYSPPPQLLAKMASRAELAKYGTIRLPVTYATRSVIHSRTNSDLL